MSPVRDHLVLFWLAMVLGIFGLSIAGLWDWNPWLRLAAPAVLMIVCSRLLAPVYYGWREPEDYPGRRTRR
jgi:hypothetical protein